MANTQPSLAAQNAQSGVVVTAIPAAAQPSIPGGIRVVGLIGTGLNYKSITATVTRGPIPDTYDLLTPVALSLPGTIIDQNNLTYSLGAPGIEDYWLSLPQSISASGVSAVTWQNNSSSIISGETLIININGDGNQSIILGTPAGPASAAPAQVAADIQLKVRALVPFNLANANAYIQFTAVAQSATNQFVLTSGTNPLGSVNVNGGTAASALKLGVANGGIEVPGGSIQWGPAGVASVTGFADVGSTAFPSGVNLNGQTFEIFANGSSLAQTVTFLGANLSPTSYSAPITGTVATVPSSVNIVGTATLFTTQLAVGNLIRFASQVGVVYQVAAINSDTSLALATVYTGTSSAGTTVTVGNGIIEQMNAAFSQVIKFNSTVSSISFTVTLPQVPVVGDTLIIPGYTYTVSPTPTALQYTINPLNPVQVIFNAAAASQFVSITYAVAPSLVASVFIPPLPSTANYIVVSTIATVNAQLQISNGTANASLGFTPGILILGPQEPTAGVKYTFTYGTPKVSNATQDDYGPILYTDLISLVAAYGPVATANDFTSPQPGAASLPPWAPWSVANTLPLGAQVVFTNSANTGGIVAVQCNPVDGAPLAQFQNALNKLANVVGINIVVCLTPDPLLTPSIVSHVVNASQPLEGNFRTAMIGFDPALITVASAISTAQGVAASGLGRRFLMPWPAAVNTTLGGNPAQLDGSFLAAAIAGLRINGNNDVATPLLRKSLFPFTAAAVNLMRTTKLQLRDGGVTVVELQNGNVLITEDTTTDRTTVDNEEFSVTEIVDFTATTTKTLLNAIFIGVKILSNTSSIITATIQVLLNNLIALNIISSYQNVTAQVSPLDPRQIDISFEIAPVYGLRFISVQFSLIQ